MHAPKSFLISVVSEENKAWHGQVILIEQQQTQSFQSGAELIRLLNTTAHQTHEDED